MSESFALSKFVDMLKKYKYMQNNVPNNGNFPVISKDSDYF